MFFRVICRFVAPALIPAVSICCSIAMGEPLDTWHWRSPAGTGNRLHGIGAGPARFVAVGELGTIIVSDNGTDWFAAASGTEGSLRAVSWGNGLWVTVGDFGEILTSPDGVAWTSRPIPWFFDLSAVTWGDGRFVAVGKDTAILTSTNGVEWALCTTGSHPLRAVAWGGGRFIAAGGEAPGPGRPGRPPGKALVLASSDGVAWNRVDVPVDGQVSCLAYGAGRFVAGTTSTRTMVSTNGTDWLPGYEGDVYSGYEFFATAHVGDRYVATYGSTTSNPAGFLSSLDGVTWTYEEWKWSAPFDYRNVRALAVNTAGVAGLTAGSDYTLVDPNIWSVDGVQWREVRQRRQAFEPPVVHSGGRFFIREVPSYDTARYEPRTETTYLISSDGQKWESAWVSGTERFGLPAFGNGRWVAGGDHGRLAVSTNAIEWEVLSSGQTARLLHVSFNGGLFVATGDNGTLLTSADGSGWTPFAAASTNTLGPAVWRSGLFAVPEAGTAAVFTSTNGGAWTRHRLPAEFLMLDSLTAWEEGFVGLARSAESFPPILIRSVDCQSWTVEKNVPADTLHFIATGGGRLLVFRGPGSRGFHARRAGETNWTTHTLPWLASLQGVMFSAPAGAAFGNDSLLLTHVAGFILQSDPLTDTAPTMTQPLAVVAASPSSLVTLQATALGSSPLQFQWKRDATNLPFADSPVLTLTAGDVAAHRIRVEVANAFGRVESGDATVAWAEPAMLELAADLSMIGVQGTPRGRYRVDYTGDDGLGNDWRTFGEIEIPSFGATARLKNIARPSFPPVSHRFFRAVAQPE